MSKYGHVVPHLETLGKGLSIGVAVPDGAIPDKWITGLRGYLCLCSRPAIRLFKWSVKRGDGSVAIVTKTGKWGLWGSEDQKFEPPKPIPLCQCGCGQSVGYWDENDASTGRVKGEPKKFIQGHHNKIRPKMATILCAICNAEFQPNQSSVRCCSFACAHKLQAFTKIKKREGKDKPEALKARGFQRKRCVTCKRYFWRRSWPSKQSVVTCSRSCKQKRICAKLRKVPLDKELLRDLFVVKGWSYAQINRHFGCHPNSTSAYTALRELGFPRRESGLRRSATLAVGNEVFTRDRLIHLRKDRGMTIKEIAVAYERSTNHVRTVMQRLGVPTSKVAPCQ